MFCHQFNLTEGEKLGKLKSKRCSLQDFSVHTPSRHIQGLMSPSFLEYWHKKATCLSVGLTQQVLTLSVDCCFFSLASKLNDCLGKTAVKL